LDCDLDLLTAALLPGVGPRAIKDLSARAPLRDALARPEEHKDLLPAEAVSLLRTGAANRRAAGEVEGARRLGITILGWDAPAYPALVRRTFDPPPVLYVRGQVTPAGTEGPPIALVGARAATSAGRALAEAMARDLASAGATVVSGLARGIDTAAHRGALRGRGRTVAVLGSALDRLYPGENADLAAAIAEEGAVVSEFPLGTGPKPGHFPRRNRVIAGWSRAVVVVEAAARSGALITARYALDEGREVMAVPGHPSQRGSSGANQLLRDGAALVRDAADVASELGLDLPSAKAPRGAGSLEGALRTGVPLSLEELEERTGSPLPELLADLGRLELEARVRRLPGPLYLGIAPETV
jgi:DNA processing protein